MNSFNDNFKIALSAKKLYKLLYNYSQNILKNDAYLKNKILDLSLDLFRVIYLGNYSQINFKNYFENIKTDIILIDFNLEILFTKKYLNTTSLKMMASLLLSIDKMSNAWFKNK